jgi:uncharacterized protein YbjT (DUF2867 family)
VYVITGASGHTGSVVAEKLLAKGQPVRAIGRSADRLQTLADKGAEVFVCDLSDTETLTRGFTAARAVYAMIPPNMSSQDYRAEQDRISESIATAIENAKVPYAVTLSSIGADKKEGTGPIAGSHYLEQRLNRIDGLNVLHLRPGYFMENTLPQIGIIKSMGVTAGPVRSDLRIPMIATRDIGNAAADVLLKLDFGSQETRELLGQRDISYAEAAQVIGNAIGDSDLAYVELPEEQVRAAFVQMGMSPNVADLILEMSTAMNEGRVVALEERTERNTTPTSYETFVAEELVPQYQGKSKAAS